MVCLQMTILLLLDPSSSFVKPSEPTTRFQALVPELAPESAPASSCPVQGEMGAGGIVLTRTVSYCYLAK